MSSFFLFMGLFLFHVAFTSSVDVREMSIDEYINFVNPPSVHQYQNEYGVTILCVKFSDQISVKYSPDNITRGLKEAPKLKPTRISISNSDSGRANTSRVASVKSQCPEGTVATTEIKREDVERAGSVRQFLNKGHGRRNNTIPDYDDGATHDYAVLRYSAPDPMVKVSATLNVWRPLVAPDSDFSLSQIWIVTEPPDTRETIEAGWMVYPQKYRSAEPTFFVFWTSNDYNNGCYNTECPGYVPSSPQYAPPQPISPVSQYGGQQYEITLSLELQVDPNAGLVWALYFNGNNMGYWPASLFTDLAQGAGKFDVGGEVAYVPKPPGTPMTATQMGSGRFPVEGNGFAAYTRDHQMYGQGGAATNALSNFVVSKPYCYDMSYYTYFPQADPQWQWGKHIFFGGPGGFNNPSCVA